MNGIVDCGVGFFGKLPALGDFVSRRLPRDFIEPWDQWLQGSLRASQEKLADDWLSLFLVSPIWRFALSPGLCGDHAWAGVMMPSVDRVGRYYPLTLAAPMAQDRLLDMFLPESTAFAHLEEVALSVLNEPFELEAFDTQLSAIRLLEQIVPARFEVESKSIPPQNASKSAFRFELDTLEQCDAVFPDFCRQLLQRYVPAHSLWATQADPGSRANFLCCEGFPPIEAYADFLKGTAHSGHSWRVHTFQSLEKASPPPVIQLSCSDSPAVEVKSASGWISSGLTVVGHKRKHNEDAMLNDPARGVWVVADGMGGHQAGDLASRLIVDSLAALALVDDGLEQKITAVCNQLQKINQELCRFANGLRQGSVVGSTVVVLLAQGDECAAIWAGDSRLYRLREGRLSKVTEDHTLIDELMASGMMSREVAEHQVGANVITRAVGGQQELLLDVLRFNAEKGDRYLLCSDGLDKEVSELDVPTFLGNGSCASAAEALIAAALAGLGRDNITVLVCQYER